MAKVLYIIKDHQDDFVGVVQVGDSIHPFSLGPGSLVLFANGDVYRVVDRSQQDAKSESLGDVALFVQQLLG
jgi:hypothetical protein